ncbi:MAG: SDR family NAD(P)-dependent oxidoreductase [Phycisphaerales bacterium JB058]
MNLNTTSSLITGGASGLGLATARRVTALGGRVCIADLNEEKGEAAAEELGGVFMKTDVCDAEQVQAAVDAALGLGQLRTVLNAAGIGPVRRTVDRDGNPFPLDMFEFVIRVNLIGTFNVTRLAAAAMAKQDTIDDDGQRGSIVNIASISAFDGQIGNCAYSAAKGGVVGMTLPIARDLAAIGVRVNSVAPGMFDTPIFGEGEVAEKYKAHQLQSVVFPKRLGGAPELASIVIELFQNDYMNGETIRVDGATRLPPS